MWVIGGSTGGKEVWSSPDGITWTLETSTPGFTARTGHTSVEFSGKIWVLGGYDGTSYKSDVWSSPDGVTWTQETAAAGWTARTQHSSLNYNGRIWVIGGLASTSPSGGRLKDVWSSLDGVTWTQVTAAAEFSARYGQTSLDFLSKMWILAGHEWTSGLKRDVWFSPP
jgi:hypothetical protein